MRTWPRALIVAGVVITALVAFAPRPAPAPELVEIQALDAVLSRMERQTRLLTESADEVQRRYWAEVAPIETALLVDKRVRDPAMARTAAWAIIRAIRTRPLSPRLIVSIMREENPWFVTDTTSHVGATGLMQVMPFHAMAGGRHREACGPNDLTDPDTNVCYGADIFLAYLGPELDKAIKAALLLYSGCVSTPGCEVYADHVLRRLN